MGIAARTEPAGAKQVGIWLRVSTEDQALGESPEHHEYRARAYAESKGWQVVKRYDLSGVSGKTVINHPSAQEMLADVRAGRITALIFSKIARLARNTKELIEIAEALQECRCDLISLGESIDTSTPGGRLFYTLLAAMAHWEREEISARVAASVPVRAKLGKPLGGAAPFGYRWEDRRLVPDPIEAPVRRLMYERFRDVKRLKTVSRELNAAGHRTRNGRPFTDTTLRRLLEDPTAKGMRRANYTKSTGDKKHWLKKPEEEWVWIPVEAVVSEELWDECNRLLAERKVTRRPPAKRPVQLFGGVTVCECGAKMYVPSNSPKYTCGECRTKIPVDDLEAVFADQLKAFFFDPVAIADYFAQADEVLVGKRELLASLEAEQRANASEIEKLYRLYLDGAIGTEAFGRRNRPLEERQTAIAESIPILQGEIDFLRIEHLSGEAMVSDARDLCSRWADLDIAEKRVIVENMVDRIVIGKGEVTIHLAYSPTPAPPPTSPNVPKGQRDVKGSSPPAR